MTRVERSDTNEERLAMLTMALRTLPLAEAEAFLGDQFAVERRATVEPIERRLTNALNRDPIDEAGLWQLRNDLRKEAAR